MGYLAIRGNDMQLILFSIYSSHLIAIVDRNILITWSFFVSVAQFIIPPSFELANFEILIWFPHPLIYILAEPTGYYLVHRKRPVSCQFLFLHFDQICFHPIVLSYLYLLREYCTSLQGLAEKSTGSIDCFFLKYFKHFLLFCVQFCEI